MQGAVLSTFTIDAVEALAGPGWLRSARREALARFEAASLPTDAEEVWRYSRIAELDLDRYSPLSGAGAEAPAAGSDAGAILPEALVPLLGALLPSATVVVIRNGRRVRIAGGDPAVTVAELAGAGGAGSGAGGVSSGAGGVSSGAGGAGGGAGGAAPGAAVLGEIAGEPDALVTLNAAFAAAPLMVRVARGATVAAPIVIVHWVDVAGVALFPRTLVQVEAGAEVVVTEVVASSDVASLVVPVTELDVADGARLGYLNVQVLGPQMWQIGLQASRVGRDATLTSAAVALGGDYARLRTDSALVGPGGTSRLLAVYFGSGDQMHDFRTVQGHQAPKTTSDLLFKGVLGNQSRSVYTGLIRVEKGAAGTNAFQTNRNLVLHEGAHADSVPNLEIEDNDVRCSHASAVGPIAEDERFYVESRGVPPEVAERLIALGFLDEVLERAPVPGLVGVLRRSLAAKLADAEAREARLVGSVAGVDEAGGR